MSFDNVIGYFKTLFTDDLFLGILGAVLFFGLGFVSAATLLWNFCIGMYNCCEIFGSF